MIEELTQQLWAASHEQRSCRITLSGEPFPRVVYPYGICKTPKNQIVLVCWQEIGFTKAGRTAGYRNLYLNEIETVEILDKRFPRREDFNPVDGQYKEWVYHI